MTGYFLRVVSGAREGLKVPLPANGDPLVVGRRTGDLILEDPLVSSRHCHILFRNGEYVLQDLGSTNGTMVDDRLVREVSLRPGNQIAIGSTRLLVFSGATEPTLESNAPAEQAPGPAEIAWLREEELVELKTPADPRSPTDVIGQDLRLPPGLHAQVEVVAGQDTGKIYRFTRGNINIGRRSGEVPLSDGEVSRRHSVIEVFGREMIFLRDLGSTNGTYHNGRRIQVARLKTSDTIGIGKTVLKLQIQK